MNNDEKTDALTAAEAAHSTYRRAQEARIEAIVAARERGATWAEVGAALHLSRSAAHQLVSRRVLAAHRS